MFYINIPKIQKNEAFFSHILPTFVVFVAFLSVAIINWRTVNSSVGAEHERIVEQNNQMVESAIADRMQTYEDILRGGVGLFSAKDQVSGRDWSKYVSNFNIDQRYPGLQGVGYAEIINEEQASDYSPMVFPEGSRDKYIIIKYIEPTNTRNLKVLGYDMYSDQIRQEAMNLARDRGGAALTDIVQLAQEKGEPNKQPGFLMYMPIYSSGDVPSSVEARRDKISGYVYAPFRSYDFINNTLTSVNEDYAFKIYRIQDEGETEVYKSPSFDSVNDANNSIQRVKKLELQGTEWSIVGSSTVDIVSRDLLNRRASVLLGGFVFSFIASTLIYLLLINRTRSLEAKEERVVQEAKDELLALASHQLRTPATGVKQYIGMVREGFAGDVTEMQKKLLDKAYDSNERQLGTINEILFVARADAGHLKMDSQTVNITDMVTSIVEEQESAIKNRSQFYEVRLPKKVIKVEGDPQYLRMALENVISNATKYTKDGGRISIRLTSNKEGMKFTVKDTGVGVSEDDYKYLFQKFSRIPNELTSKVSGSGIGLYLTKKIVESHNGWVKFESGLNEGSKVTIFIPKRK